MSVVEKHGYTRTELGWIPSDWSTASFGSLLAEKPEYGANASAEGIGGDGYIRYIRITDIRENGSLIESGKKYIPFSVGKGYLLRENDILIARTGNTVGKSLLFSATMGEAAFAGYLIRFRVGSALNCRFASQYLHSDAYWEWVKKAIKVGAQPNINSQQYQSMLLPLPPLDEQEKIAAILASVDDKLDVIYRQIETTKILRHGLMQTVFSRGIGSQDANGRWAPHINFKDILSLRVPSAWTAKRLGDIAPLIRRPVEVIPDVLYPELGLRSFGKGTFHKPALLGIEIGKKRMFEIKSGDLLFSNVFAWEGALAVAKPEDDGRFGSHRYITCKVDEVQADTSYVFKYLTTPVGIASLTLASPGGAGRNKTLGLTALANIAMPLPPLVEQQKISQILNGVDAKIAALELRQSMYQKLKRGLIQKLLTGEWRLKTYNSAEEKIAA